MVMKVTHCRCFGNSDMKKAELSKMSAWQSSSNIKKQGQDET
jgi:hypothetical protein